MAQLSKFSRFVCVSGGVDITWVSITLAMLGKFAINMSFTIIYIYGPEIYPTVVRYCTRGEVVYARGRVRRFSAGAVNNLQIGGALTGIIL